MKKIIFCLIIWAFNQPAAAIDYNDFPPNLQQILNEKIAELKEKGGICIAGSVITNDEVFFSSGKEVKVNLYFQGIDSPTDIYDGGWFIMDHTLKASSRRGPAKLILRAFGYDPIDASISVLQGQITYLDYVMQKTPDENLATITGTVVNDQNEPLGGIGVNLTFTGASKEQPRLSKITEPNGRYLFEKLIAAEYDLYTFATSKYAGFSTYFTPEKGKTALKDIKLYPNISIVIDYVYQSDGSCRFTNGELQTGTIEWVSSSDGVDFSDGKEEGFDPSSPRDIDKRQNQNVPYFMIFLVKEKNGFYDAGDVDFESVKEAAESGYSTGGKPCVVGHTYVVRTTEGNYAKFVVRSISGSE